MLARPLGSAVYASVPEVKKGDCRASIVALRIPFGPIPTAMLVGDLGDKIRLGSRFHATESDIDPLSPRAWPSVKSLSGERVAKFSTLRGEANAYEGAKAFLGASRLWFCSSDAVST